jgi:hypothetical protein
MPRLFILLALVALLGCESKVDVKTPNVKVKVDGDGVKVDAPGVKVDAGKDGVKVDKEKK